MITNPNFKIDVSVTEKCYKSKPTPTDYRQMRWNKTKMSLSSFISMVRMGFTAIAIFTMGTCVGKINFSIRRPSALMLMTPIQTLKHSTVNAS